MFERVQFDEWQTIITIVAFILCFSTFIYFCWRAMRMSKSTSNHMSSLPLESEDQPAYTSDERSLKK